MEDNVLGSGAASCGKLMVYGQGEVKAEFLDVGLKYDPKRYLMHANHTDFQTETIASASELQKKRKQLKQASQESAKKFKPIKVATPGTFLDEDSESSEKE